MKKLQISEDTISMFLGLAIVVVVVGLIFNFVQRNRGNISVPGISINQSEEVKDISEEGAVEPGKSDTENEYMVKKGDSIWKIALNYFGDGNKWIEIAKVNNLANPSIIHAGDKLILPPVGETEKVIANQNGNSVKPPQSGSDYQVVRGDSLWKISVRAYADGYKWTEVWGANKNKLRDPNKLEIGMILNLPPVEAAQI